MNTAFHLIVGDGPMGRGVAAELAARGIPCALGSRSNSRAAIAGVQPQRVDALDLPSLLAASAHATHVYITLGLAYKARVWQRDWPRIIDNFCAAARQHGFKLVFFDNIYAYGPTPLQVPMREDHPQHPVSRKGQVRLAMLQRLQKAEREEGLQLVIGRCADFYGPEVHNSMLYLSAMARQQQGKQAQWIGDPRLPHSFTYTRDAARALVQLALDSAAYGEAWHLPTASPAPSTQALIEQSAALLGAPSGVQIMPGLVLTLLKLVTPILRELDEMLYQNQQAYVFSSEKFMRRYPDFQITPYERGIRETVAALHAISPKKSAT